MTAQGDGSGRARILNVGLATVAFVGVAFAATGGPVPLATEGTGGSSLRIPERRRDVELTELAEDRFLREPADSTAVDVVSVLAQVAGIIAFAVVVFFIGRAVLRVFTAAPPGDTPVVASADLAPPTGPPTELSEAVDDGLAVLAAGPVDDVIIACWVRLEEAAAAGGVRRLPSETSAELAVRMLARFDVPAEPVERLLALYRAARYSRHRPGEDDRIAAIVALQEIGAAMAVTV